MNKDYTTTFVTCLTSLGLELLQVHRGPQSKPLTSEE